ncbi:hypothetical protein OSB04_001100, partial [Centaurea solstitialis]
MKSASVVVEKMGVLPIQPSHARSLWWERLGSAFRTAIACTVIGCYALYSPDYLSHMIQYPSVAYVTAILIVSDATLGTTLRGSWQALGATLLVVPSSVLCLWVVGPSRFTEAGAAFAVALSAFLVALPECLPLLTKRIAFAQLVIIYVGAVVRGEDAGPVTHPVHIAACTALGASASVLALILPYPRLAVTEVKKQFQLYTENASERTSLYMKAFLSEDETTADDLVSQAKPIAQSGTHLVNHINHIQEGLKWERHRIRDFKRGFVNMGDRLDDIETPIKGMEMALAAIPSFPHEIANDELKTVLQSARVQEILKLEDAKCFVPFNDAVTVPERKDDLFDKSLHTLANVSPTHRNLPAFFFLSCFELLVNNSRMSPKPETHDAQKVHVAEDEFVNRPNKTQTSKERLVFALKCSISLGLAVLLGMIFDKKNGYWSGLTIAISFVEGRLPIFTVANARVQGTAIGTVYGVLGSCLLHQFPELRFVILLPWIVFTSLLHHSQMFGESGGIAAVIGALLILGRKNYGPPKEFAIARITEVSIGLFFFVLLELLLKPVRPTTMVKQQLSRCLRTVDECLHRIATRKENGAPISPSPREHLKKLKTDINHLKNLSQDAKSEPNFCSDGSYKELQEHIYRDLVMLKETASPQLKRLERISLVKSIDAFEHQLQEKEGFLDLESANRQLRTR